MMDLLCSSQLLARAAPSFSTTSFIFPTSPVRFAAVAAPPSILTASFLFRTSSSFRSRSCSTIYPLSFAPTVTATDVRQPSTMAIHATSRSSPSATPPQPSFRPALFIRTLIPSGATSLTHSCALLPPSLQLVTATTTTLSILTVDNSTHSLQPLCTTPLFSPPRALSSLPPTPHRPAILLVLAPHSKLFFLRFDPLLTRLVPAGEADLQLPPPPPRTILNDARLLATHPRRPLVAVTAVAGSISVFPLLFLANGVAAGKAIVLPVTGIVLALDFLEDDGGDAVLIALLQNGTSQQLALFSVLSSESAAIEVRKIASMINCSSRPDDAAVARAAAKLTGAAVRPPELAVGVSRLPGCPYLFAVFVKGRVVAGDARSVLISASKRDASQAEHSLPHYCAVRCNDGADASAGKASLDLPAPLPAFLHQHQWETGEVRETFLNAGVPAIRTEAVRAVADPDLPLRSPRYVPSAKPKPTTDAMSPGKDLLSYLYVPAFITLEIGDENGAPIAWVDARDHFLDASGDGRAIYFVTESGAMFALKWSDKTQEGAATFRIPGSERAGSLEPHRNFSVEFIGDVGPAAAIAALDDRLIHIANDGADGSLRRLHIPKGEVYRKTHVGPVYTTRKGGSVELRRFGLEVRQEFLNLAPISDFVVIPPTKRAARSEKRSRASGPDDRPHRHRLGNEKHGHAGGLQLDLGRREHVAQDVDVEDERTPQRLDLAAEPRRRVRPRESRESMEDRSAYSHAMYGGDKESEIIVCSGFGRQGSIRMIRPGAPVTIFASSKNKFMACNDMWPLRFSKDAKYDAALVLTFAQATGILYSVPMTIMEQVQQAEGVPAVAKLVDGTQATNLRSDIRTIAIGAVEDGILAQIHENGVRLMYLKTVEEVPSEVQSFIKDGVLTESVCKRTLDWEPPDGGFISVGAIGAGCALVCVVRRGRQMPLLCLLNLYPGDYSRGIFVVSTAVLDHELSSIVIPERPTTQSHQELASAALPPIAVLGTYAPSVEVRLLDPTLQVLDRRGTYPWSLNNFGLEGSDSWRNCSGDRPRSARTLNEAHHCTRNSLFIRHSKSAVSRMTAIPESLCTLVVDGRKLLFAGLRDGSVICFSFTSVNGSEEEGLGSSYVGRLRVEFHRKLGHRPVVVKNVTAGIGPVVIGQTERPWVCTSLGGGRLRWIPLAFIESTAVCGYSVLGAERCFALVGEDDALHICGLRRRSEVSVRSMHIGATPRRVLALSHPEHSILVATSKFVKKKSPQWQQGNGGWIPDGEERQELQSELRIYNRRLRAQTGGISLAPREQVHVMFNWLGFIVVGTSCGIRMEKSSGVGSICNRGRILLYTVRSKTDEGSSSSAAAGSSRLLLCSEVVLPGAVLSGAGHPTARVFVISCNEEVIVFGVPRSRTSLVEIARTSVRALVVSISICEDVICVVDRKDSAAFYTLEPGSGKLVRDRTDHRRRIVSDAVMVDRTLAIAVDRRGGLFSIGYDEGDAPKRSPILWPEGHCVHSLIDRSDSSAVAEHAAGGALDGQSGAPLPSQDLGQEFDVIHPESGSENSAESNEDGQIAAVPAEEGPNSGETDQVMANESSTSLEESASGVTTNNTGTGGMADTQDAGTDTANPTQSTDDGVLATEQANVPVITTAFANIMNQETSVPARQDAASALPRNLACHHTFNMGDTALRIRLETFCRSEKITELEERKMASTSQSKSDKEQFFRDASSAVFCGTLGGALIAAVPMSASMYALLGQVEAELSVHPDITGAALGTSHKKFRSAYGTIYDVGKKGTVDGDLLNYFDSMNRSSKLGIAAQVGCPGEQGVLHIEGAIRDLFDRVS